MQRLYVSLILLLLCACSRGGDDASGTRAHSSRVVAPEPRERVAVVLDAEAPSDSPTLGARVAAGPVSRAETWFGYGVMLPVGADAAVVQAWVETALHAEGVALLAGTDEPVPGAVSAFVEVLSPVVLGYEAELLAYKGRGVDADVDRLNAANHAIAVFGFAPPAQRLQMIQQLSGLVYTAASLQGGWILDTTTREVYAPATFVKIRPADVSLDVSRLITVHIVREDTGDRVFLQTIGLDRLGVPDLLIRDIHRGFAQRVDVVLQAAAQTLLEQGTMPQDGVFEVDWSRLDAPNWQALAAAVTRAGGTGRIALQAVWSANTIDGEPPVIALTLADGDEALARQLEETLGPIPGEIWQAQQDDPELDAARARAQTAIAALAPHFAAGIPLGERLLVKAPFGDATTGIEWMWVEVDAWEGDILQGLLSNQPGAIPGLHQGMRVEVRQSELFDYLHTRADQSEVGNETTEILVRRQGGR